MTKQQIKSQPSSRKTKTVNFDTVRQLGLALPGVEEGLSSGTPVLRVRGKFMAHLQQDDDSLLIRIDYLKRDILLNADPKTFYVTDFYRCHPMMLVRLSSVDRKTLSDLLEQAWRLTAPKRLVEAFDSKLSR
ncbi:MAG TPA: MmcQ/YjbR family DNA-binding protein [Blastocatellia bacterium]|nr:MmcQ/YjbR family DNA-binding protein [Blastocatellia bacterium]